MEHDSNFLLSVADLEKRFGVCHATIYALIKSGQLESSKIGKRRVFTKNQIAAFESSLENQAKREYAVVELEVHESTLEDSPIGAVPTVESEVLETSQGGI